MSTLTVAEQIGGYKEIPGTEGWRSVVSIDSGGGYEWTQFEGFYSPTERRYFWIGGSGCSCNALSDDVTSAADFENGDRAALDRAIHAFAEEHRLAAVEALDAVSALQKFNEKETNR